MADLLNQIVLYLDYLTNESGLNVSVHFKEEVLLRIPKETLGVLLRYNSHTNPYCMAVKRKAHLDCIKSQKEIIKRCMEGESFFRECHAGVYEYICPIFKGKSSVGFVAASGYRKKRDGFFSDSFKESLSEEVPTDLLSAVIAPLSVMFEKLLSELEERPEDEYNQILQFLSEYHTDITLDDLCRHFARSKSHISHMFKSSSGMTIRAYANMLKLEDAKKLLDETNLSVTETAMEAGFGDVSYFIKLFKQHYGISPLKYRKL